MFAQTLNPVVLVTGAAAGLGAASVPELARKASGGLILVDSNEEQLGAAADSLAWAPERVSTLAFDVSDKSWWKRATDFIAAHYGRLDWALIDADAAQAAIESGELWRRDSDASFDAVILSLHSIMPLMRRNSDGGAIVVVSSAIDAVAQPAGAAKVNLLQLTRAAAQEGASANVRVNAVATATDAALRMAPLFDDLVRDHGGAQGAFEALAKTPSPVARYTALDDAPRLAALLLSEPASLTGAALVAEARYTL